MLKQELLDCLHSKVRWYAIHQSKKVSFQINPNLERNEDLRKAVHELQFVPDYEDAEKPSSDVLAEIYGNKYPVLTVHDMKEYQFWPFVTSDNWDGCTSLRVTEGDLLSNIRQTYKDLENNGLVLRFTTKMYESVVLQRGRNCLKMQPTKKRSSHSRSSDGSDTDDASPLGEELTKISFTYYGINVEQLRDVLRGEGLTNVTVNDILKQNSLAPDSGSVKTGDLPSLWEVCEKRRDKDDQLTVLRVGQPKNDEDSSLLFVNTMGRKEKIFKRKFTVGNIAWLGDLRHKDTIRRGNDQVSILNPLNRHVLLEKKKLEREKNARRNRLHSILNDAFNSSKNPYESWWFKKRNYKNLVNIRETESSDRLGTDPEDSLKTSVTSCSPTSDGMETTTENELILPTLSPMKRNRSIVVNNLANVDKWTCECEVCTGGLLSLYKSYDSTLHMLCNRLGRQIVAERPRTEVLIPEAPPKEVTKRKPSAAERRANLLYSTMQMQVRQQQQEGSRGDSPKKKQSKNSGGKKKKASAGSRKSRQKTPPIDVWWKSVSTYKTAYWKKDPNDRKQSIVGRDWFLQSSDGYGCEMSGKTGIDPRNLKLSYSIDRLRSGKFRKPELNATDEEQQKEIDPELQDLEPVVDAQSDESPAPTTVTDSLDLKALDTHGIVYNYIPGQGQEYTKINLNREKSETTANVEVTEESANDTNDAASAAVPEKAIEVEISQPTDLSAPSLPPPPPPPLRPAQRTKPKKPENVTPPCNEILSSEDKCSEFINSEKSRTFMATPSDLSEPIIHPDVGASERLFECNVPPNFPLLCLVALRDFVIRTETVMTSKTYEKIESLTVNRMPFCAYGRPGISKDKKR